MYNLCCIHCRTGSVKLICILQTYYVQSAYRFFEGALHERPHVLSVDPMPRDGHQVTTGRHDITQQGEVTIVHVGPVERDHMMQLLLHGLSHSLDAKNPENLDDIIRRRTHRINGRLTENFHQIYTICFEDPFLKCLVLPVAIDDDFLLGVLGGPVHVDLGDLFDALEGHVREEVGLQTAEERVILHLVQLLLILKRINNERCHDKILAV